MSKKIKHYVGKVNGPFVKKGEIYKKNPMNIAIDSTIMGTLKLEQYPETYEPVYEEEVLPGIVYEEYVEAYMNLRDITIHTISVNGVEWSVGEKVTNKTEVYKHVIKSFEYKVRPDKIKGENKTWLVYYSDVIGWDDISDLRKIPLRKPIITLKDENGKNVDLFEGDKYWFVFTEDLEIMAFEIQKSSVVTYDTFFPTKAAAEKYVYDNKPFYPRGLVEPLIVGLNYSFISKDSLDKLESFKAKMEKDGKPK